MAGRVFALHWSKAALRHRAFGSKLTRHERAHADEHQHQSARKLAMSAQSMAQLSAEQHAGKRDKRGNGADDSARLKDVGMNHCEAKADQQRVNVSIREAQGLGTGRNRDSQSGASGDMSLLPTVGKPGVEVAGWPRGKVHQQLLK